MVSSTVMMGLRGAQLLLAVIVLGLSAYLTTVYNNLFGYGGEYSTGQDNFMVFNAVWTFLVLAYVTFAPLYFPALAHNFIMLAVEALTCLFWFAGFIALAVIVWFYAPAGDNAYHSAQADAAMGAFEWLLFLATTVLTGLNALGNKGTGVTSTGPAMEHTGV